MYPGTYAAVTPDKPALIVAGSRQIVTYRELADRSAQLARLLYDRGLRPGDVVALLAENHPAYLDVLWAAMRSGLYLTAINRYSQPDEVAYILRDSGAAALVTTSTLAPTAAAAVADLPTCTTRLVLPPTITPAPAAATPSAPAGSTFADGSAPATAHGTAAGLPSGFADYADAVAGFSTEPLDRQPRGEIMLYSSGTTGRPKGIRRPLPGVAVTEALTSVTATQYQRMGGLDQDCVYFGPAPLYHSAPLRWARGAQELGATVVIMAKFDARELLEIIERERVTHLQAVPTMFVRLLRLPAEVRGAYDLSSLRHVLHAGAPCPVPVKQQMIDWLGPIITEYYSGTEGAGMTVISAPEWLAHPGSVGRAYLGTLRVCGEDGGELPAGQTGAIYFEREDTVFEYHNDPAKTRSVRHPAHDTWLTYGDIGHVDVDGYLYLTDRAAFTIISGGVNIYPAEIEACLAVHPDVADVAVFGLPDPEMGEYVHAVVQLLDGVAPTPERAEALRAYVRANLAAPKVPRIIDFRPDLPRLPTGKLYKVPLRQEYLDRTAEISFRRVTEADFTLLRGWLAAAHVARWWNHETSAEAVERDFGPTARGEEPAEDFLALLDGEPVGLVQRCVLADYPEDHDALAALVDVPAGTVSIDYLIGDRVRTGHGLGPRIIAAILARTWTDHPEASCVLVPVAAANRPSWRALEKAGLHRIGQGDLTPDNPIDEPLHYLHRIDRPTPAQAP